MVAPSKFDRRRVVASGISILVSCCGLASLTAAQAPPPSVHLLQTLLQSAFPELQQVGNRISITLEAGFGSDWTTSGICHFRLFPRDYKPPEAETVENHDDQFLAGRATIVDGYIEQLGLHGLHVRSRENAALLKRAQDHP